MKQSIVFDSFMEEYWHTLVKEEKVLILLEMMMVARAYGKKDVGA